MTKYKYTSDWILNLEKELHWRWYWHQQKLMEKRIPKDARIAEIGVGSGFTYNYLKSKGYQIVSIDIDAKKEPDLLLNVVDCDDSDLNFDVILAFNIFEHIPYKEFLDTIEKFSRNKIQTLFIGLPLNRKIIFETKLRIGRFFDKTLTLTIPKRKITTDNHHWELAYKKFSSQKMISDFSDRNYLCMDYFYFKLQSYFYFQLRSDDI